MDKQLFLNILWARAKTRDTADFPRQGWEAGLKEMAAAILQAQAQGQDLGLGEELPAAGTDPLADAVRSAVEQHLTAAGLNEEGKPQEGHALPQAQAQEQPQAQASPQQTPAPGAQPGQEDTANAAPQADKRLPQRKKGMFVSLAALVVFILASLSTIQIGSLSYKNSIELLRDEAHATCFQVLDTQNKPPNKAFFLESNAPGCYKAWNEARTRVLESNWMPWIGSMDYYRKTTFYCLSLPFFCLMASIGAMLCGAGIVARGSVLAVLADPSSGRMSLSRLQAVLWTILLLGGYTVISMYNIGVSTEGVLLLQVLASIKSDVMSTQVLEHYKLFPEMDIELWTLIGITLGSPILSALVTKTPPAGMAQPQPPADAPLADQIVPGFSDLFLGTQEESRGVIDLSRLQNCVFTGILLLSYMQLLFKSVNAIGPTQLILSVTSITPVFPNMPRIDSSFLALLVLSHGVYLGAKLQQGKAAAPPPA